MNKSSLLLSLLMLLSGLSVVAYATDMDEFREAISGNTAYLHHKKKDFDINRYFAADGTLIEEIDGEFSRGQWSIEDDKLCIAYPDKPVKCRKIKGSDGDYAIANRNGKKRAIIFEAIEEGNTLELPEGFTVEKEKSTIREELFTIDTREGVTQSFLLMEPVDKKPAAVVIVYVGHDGTAEFTKVGDRYAITSFNGGLPAHGKFHKILTRKKIALAIMAAPSDYDTGLTTEFRESKEHAEDAAKVIAFLKQRYGQKVYLYGHCRSTFSPAAVATHLKNRDLAGVILSSTRSQGRYGSVMELPKGAIKVPVLLVHHVDDPCEGTPYKNIDKVKKFYEASSPDVKLITVRGGDGNRGNSNTQCGGGHHTFKAQQGLVSHAIRDWLLKLPVPKEINEED